MVAVKEDFGGFEARTKLTKVIRCWVAESVVTGGKSDDGDRGSWAEL
jgi:hypothetical protein